LREARIIPTAGVEAAPKVHLGTRPPEPAAEAFGSATVRGDADAQRTDARATPPSTSSTCAELYQELERVEISLVQERGHSEQIERTYRQKLEEQHKLHAQDVAALEEMICEVLAENQRLASRVSALEVGGSLDGALEPSTTPGGGAVKSEATRSGGLSSDQDCYASTCSLLTASDEPLRTPRMQVYEPQICCLPQLEKAGPVPDSHALLSWKKSASESAGAGSDTESDRTTAEQPEMRLFSGVAGSVCSDVPVVQCAT
jgi:hypothetical protein